MKNTIKQKIESAVKIELENSKEAFFFWGKLFFGDFFNWLVIASILMFWIFQWPSGNVVSLRNDWDHLMIAIAVSILIPTITGGIRHFSSYDRTLRKFYDAGSIMMLIEKTILLFQGFSLKQPNKVGMLKIVFDRFPEDFGGIVIGADEREYIERLLDLIPLTQKSFYATLRGGDLPKYNIEWFFENTPKEEGVPVILEKRKKIEYLRKVNDLTVLEEKVRIVLLNKNEMGPFHRVEVRNNFFDLNSSVAVYLINPKTLSDLLVRQTVDGTTLDVGQTSFIWEDYAVFDSCIAVKHDGKNSLYLGVQDQIQKMLLPFKLIKAQPHLFKKIDKRGIYEYYDPKWNFAHTWESYLPKRKE